ncbi:MULTISPECIES: hypothetical protein [Klebsiella]|uniref:hypothetical protein n=1 Tax=Klebsiella TaxID=570 RepID=UPI001C7DEEC8|nr:MULTISPECIES: hypothetical protein [Klebsiella]MCI8226347.1 hypothetical protein [Klebsiella pneumoniae]MDK3051995.1 hypothetical protein [Klebsiella michiganensis]MDS0501576.1 hypothetical protein [Klebsiella pneumoniae]HBQ6765820.1 hypothetical protein [Klebsiella pneumoniae]HCK7108180.1 hypothetical protein [Klebsiella pneumoniae]
MEYELYNNHCIHECIVLLDIEIIDGILKGYNTDDELLWVGNFCTEEPKSVWIAPGRVLAMFNVPLLVVNDENEFRVSDGRHRIFWMKGKDMNAIPVAITKSALKNLQQKGIKFEVITTLDMPCSVIPNLQHKVESKPLDANHVIKKLARK